MPTLREALLQMQAEYKINEENDELKVFDDLAVKLDASLDKIRQQVKSDSSLAAKVQKFLQQVDSFMAKRFSSMKESAEPLNENAVNMIVTAIKKIAQVALAGAAIILEAVMTTIDLVINVVYLPFRAIGAFFGGIQQRANEEGPGMAFVMGWLNLTLLPSALGVINTTLIATMGPGLLTGLFMCTVVWAMLKAAVLEFARSGTVDYEDDGGTQFFRSVHNNFSFSRAFREARRRAVADVVGNEKG